MRRRHGRLLIQPTRPADTNLTGIVAGEQGITTSFQAHADAALAPLTFLSGQPAIEGPTVRASELSAVSLALSDCPSSRRLPRGHAKSAGQRHRASSSGGCSKRFRTTVRTCPRALFGVTHPADN
jgi:hypothetical protein